MACGDFLYKENNTPTVVVFVVSVHSRQRSLHPHNSSSIHSMSSAAWTATRDECWPRKHATADSLKGRARSLNTPQAPTSPPTPMWVMAKFIGYTNLKGIKLIIIYLYFVSAKGKLERHISVCVSTKWPTVGLFLLWPTYNALDREGEWKCITKCL